MNALDKHLSSQARPTIARKRQLTGFSRIFAALILIVGLQVSCSNRDASTPDAFYDSTRAAMKMLASPSDGAMPTPEASTLVGEQSDRDAITLAAGRKLVYEASLDIEVLDLPSAEAGLADRIKAAGGYVSMRNADENSIYIQARVPVDTLEPIMAALAGQGRVLERSLSAEDVTDRYFDLEGRLRNKRLLESRYRDYLTEASTMDEILQVERSLSELTNEIEWLEGSFRDLGKRVELATLSVNLRAAHSVDLSRPGLGQSLGRLLAGFGEALRIFLLVLAGLVLYGIPALLFLAVLWWLAFGRLGLVRRLFRLAGIGKKKAGMD